MLNGDCGYLFVTVLDLLLRIWVCLVCFAWFSCFAWYCLGFITWFSLFVVLLVLLDWLAVLAFSGLFGWLGFNLCLME